VKRGDLVTVALTGDNGKPRPALIVQADAFEALGSVLVAPLTSTVDTAPLIRVVVDPAPSNGLLKQSAIMVDKLVAVPRGKVGPAIGYASKETMAEVGRVACGLLGLD
jgi:mRNA interferase MazF